MTTSNLKKKKKKKREAMPGAEAQQAEKGVGVFIGEEDRERK